MPKVRKALKEELTELVNKISEANSEADSVLQSFTEKEESSDMWDEISEVWNTLQDLQDRVDAYTSDDAEYTVNE